MSYDPYDPYAAPKSEDYYGEQPGYGEPKHSGMGIASFIIAILAGIGMFGLVVMAGVMESQPGGMDEESPAAIVLGLAIFAAMGLNLLGVGLGIAGLVQANRNRLFAVLGAIFNALIILGVCGLIAIGLAMG